MAYRFLSFGGGVQSTALLLMDSYDEVIFADTQGEHPETYDYMAKFHLPYVKEKGIKFTVLDDPVNDRRTGIATKSLEEFCLTRKMTPSRQNRWCTERFKIRRIARYIKEGGHKPAIAVMGISWDEMHRMHTSHSRAYSFEYPLVDKRMTREDCRKVIINHGWPVPPKSGCWYCPFQRLAGWRELYFKHPDLYKRAQRMEEQQSHFPNYVLAGNGMTLERMAGRFGKGSMSLDEFGGEPCDSGACFT
jgi:hypothetical protein